MSVYNRKVAQRNYPGREVQGTGEYVLVSECAPDTPVMLFTAESERQAVLNLWASGGCGAGCIGKHVLQRIKPAPQYVWERD